MSDRNISVDFLTKLYADWCRGQGFTQDEITSADEMLTGSIELDPCQRKWLEGYCAVWDTVVGV